jgi:hypothetical protein
LFYSHIGTADANFFGANGAEGAAVASANFMLIPVDLKVGYLLPSGNVRFSVHGGGNVTYRSVAGAVSLGEVAAADASNSSWNIYPNAGLDAEFGPFIVRPDWTFTSGNSLLTATAGIVFPLG